MDGAGCECGGDLVVGACVLGVYGRGIKGKRTDRWIDTFDIWLC